MEKDEETVSRLLMTRKVDNLRTDKSIWVRMEERGSFSKDRIELNLSTFFPVSPVNAQRLILFANFSLIFTLNHGENCANFLIILY